MIYFITGSSGVGKSTSARALKEILTEGFVVHDFDEVGIPHGADKAWRLATTRKWIETTKENTSKGISTVIVGLTHPDEVKEIAWAQDVEVRFVMLEVEQEELKRRLIAWRFSSPERIENLKKYEGVAPEEFFENNKRHVAHIKNEALTHNAVFIDTTDKSPEAVAVEVARLLQNQA